MLGQTLSRHLKHGKLQWLGKPLYEGLVALELKWVERKERDRLPFKHTPLVNTASYRQSIPYPAGNTALGSAGI